MLLTTSIFLGHFISCVGIQVDPTKIEVISKLPGPISPRDVRRFLGHAGYYRQIIETFTRIVAPLFKLLTKDTNFSWDDLCQNAFEVLKVKLTKEPILRGPNWSLPFHISTNASNTTLRAVLGQQEN
jgi:hypothetical protein